MAPIRTSALILLVVATVACGGDETKPPAAAASTTSTGVSPDDYRKAQQAYADSVLNASRSSKEVVERLGKEYAVGSVRLRDSLALLVGKTDCFLNGRKSDPYLAGTVSFFVFMSPVGSNVVRVQDEGTTWTSAAGNIVNSCLNIAAQKWKFNESFGKQGGYITQVQFK
jgi:hypothetical protein